MDVVDARRILGECTQSDNSLYSLDWYVRWDDDMSAVILDGEFEAEDLEAIAWWMKRYKRTRDVKEEVN